MMTTEIAALANRPPATLTEAEIEAAVAAIAADPRTHSVSRARSPDENHPAMLAVVINDTAEGRIEGIYSLGRVLGAMRYTEASYQATIRARAEADALTLARAAAIEARYVENIDKLAQAGCSLAMLHKVRLHAQRGIYITEPMQAKYQIFCDMFDTDGTDMDFENILRGSKVRPPIMAPI